MALIKYRLGDLLQLLEVKNDNLQYGIDSVRGVNNLKKMMPTKADLNGRDLSKFQIVNPGEFFFNHRTSRNGSKFSITYNGEANPIICTEDYVVFKIKQDYESILLADWLYMYFNRSEFDRYVITNSWGSSTEFYNWEDICSIELNLPPLTIQHKYVDIYGAMIANQQSYERGLEDLKTVCDGYIENLRRNIKSEKLGSYIIESDMRNDSGLTVDAVRGIATSKALIPTKANMNGVSLSSYKTVLPKQIAYVSDTSRRGDKMSLGFNNTNETFLVSSISTVFETKKDKLLPEYLMLFLTRSEFDRYARFCSWGSARETFEWDEMCNLEIPIPDISVQQAISNIFEAYNERKKINEELKGQIARICPILISGSIEEARKET